MDERRPELSDRIAKVVALDPSVPALEYQGHWYSWGDLGAATRTVAEHVQPGERVAVLLRNRPAHVAVVLGLLRAGACVVTTNPERGTERVRADLGSLGVGTFAGERADLEALAPTARWMISDELGPVEVSGERPSGTNRRSPGVAVEMLTSGTTGPPKRVDLTYETFTRVLDGAKHYERDASVDLRLRSGITIVSSPLVHLGGLFRILTCLNDGRSFCLLEKFRVDDWADAVRHHRPRTVSLVPAALRMVLEADLDPDDLSSVRSVISGTAPLAPEDADAFREKYGVPVLISYAATEFGGGVAGWNLADHEEFWAKKRGSVGRAHPGCELRVVDPDTGAPLGADEEGRLEVKTRQLGDASPWIRTTDQARIDADGFLWILGRSDQAIIRGGFKIRPEDVRAALEGNPRVRGAAVVSRPDARLGAVPVAAVELRPGEAAVTAEDLLADAALVLSRYELPSEVKLVDELPRTPSGKVDLVAVRELFAVEP